MEHERFKLDIMRRNPDGSLSEFHVEGTATATGFTEQEIDALLVGTEILLNAQGNPRYRIWLDTGKVMY